MTGTLSELDRALALTRRTDQPDTYDARLDVGWQIGHGVNGGLLMALLGTALRTSLADGPHVDPVSVSAYYLSASTPGPASVRTQLLRAGRSMSTAGASLVQVVDGREVERIRALATYADLAALPQDVRTSATPPQLPPLEDCLSNRGVGAATGMGETGFLDRVDIRLDPACAGWASGAPSGRGVLQGWLRLADGREPDTVSLLLAADAFPPVSFDLGLIGWTPTLELTVHVRARPAPGWLRVKATSVNRAGDLLDEDVEVWDSADRLVVQARQLARLAR